MNCEHGKFILLFGFIYIVGGMETMVHLLGKENRKFLAVTADCLHLLAYGHQDSKVCEEDTVCTFSLPGRYLCVLLCSSLRNCIQ